MLPLILTIRIKRKDHRRLKLFIPVFLVWLIGFALMIVLLPLVLITALFTWRTRTGKSLFMAGPMLVFLLFNLTGLRVEIQEKEKEIAFIMQ